MSIEYIEKLKGYRYLYRNENNSDLYNDFNYTFVKEGAEHYDWLKVNNVFNIDKLNDTDNDYSKIEELYKNKVILQIKILVIVNNMEINAIKEVDITNYNYNFNNKEKRKLFIRFLFK